MPLKFRFKSREEIPTEHAPLYVERDGSWVLDAEGAVEKARLDEFRTNNIELKRQVEDFQKRFEGIDPEKAREALKQSADSDEQKLIKAGEIDKLLEKRTLALRTELEKRATEAEKERDLLHSRLTDVEINQGVVLAATKRGVRPAAIPDVISRARSVFRLIDGKVTAFEADGKTVRYGRDGITPLTVEEWAEELASQASHLFEPNTGTGGAGSASHPGLHGRVGKNPFKRGADWNLTEQMKIARTDPALAARLRGAS